MSMYAPPTIDSTFGGNSPDTRRTDPEPSHEARDSSNAKASLGAVLTVLRGQGPMTDQELVGQMEVAHVWDRVPMFTEQRIRTARAALTEQGLVEFTGYYRLTVSGRRARVWTVTS